METETQTVACACCAREVSHVDTEWQWCDDCLYAYEPPDEELDDYENPRDTYERERGEAFQDRVDMWRSEY